jgi:hypothetical protein
VLAGHHRPLEQEAFLDRLADLWRAVAHGSHDPLVWAPSGASSITPYLDIWAQTPDEAAARHLTDFISRLFCRELDTWLASGAPSVRLREADAVASGEIGAGFVEALEQIDGYRTWFAGRLR